MKLSCKRNKIFEIRTCELKLNDQFFLLQTQFFNIIAKIQINESATKSVLKCPFYTLCFISMNM